MSNNIRLYNAPSLLNINYYELKELLKNNNIHKPHHFDSINEHEFEILKKDLLSKIAKTAKSATESGYSSNKEVKFKTLDSIYIESFRSLKDRTIALGKNITIISGKNGTMKSSLLGLIAHPFSSPNNAKDIFNQELKTEYENVFRLSPEKDHGKYVYYLNATTDKDINISEKIRFLKREEGKKPRIFVGATNEQGLGNFLLNTSYINLKRLFPIIDTDANVAPNINLLDSEKRWISRSYSSIMTRNSFANFDCISDKQNKNTFGPKDAAYDFNAISSGEDNLGNILMKMLSFARNKTDESILQGIFCIDEIEASLHPIALTNLFDFLLKWSEEHNVQIVATTHSLYLIDHILKYQDKYITNKEKVCLNIVSTVQVGNDNNYRILNNPSYKDAYKELTLKTPESEPLFKVNILCEDEVAIKLLKNIIKSKSILNNIEFILDVSGNANGTGCQSLIALGKNGYRLLEDSIIIVDSEVKPLAITKVKEKNVDIFIVPDKENINNRDGCRPEQNIINFAMELEGNNNLIYSKIFYEKRVFLNSLHKYYIFEETPLKEQNNNNYKNWVKQYTKEFNKLLELYVSENHSIFDNFRIELLNAINKKRSNKGLSQLSY